MIQIQDTIDFVLTLKAIKKALGEKPEAKEASRLIHKIQRFCSHSKADRKDGELVGVCPDCQKKFDKKEVAEKQ